MRVCVCCKWSVYVNVCVCCACVCVCMCVWVCMHVCGKVYVGVRRRE